MVQKHPPTVLSSRTIHGVLQSSSSHNLSWSSDGQCLVTHRRGINIFVSPIYAMARTELTVDTICHLHSASTSCPGRPAPHYRIRNAHGQPG